MRIRTLNFYNISYSVKMQLKDKENLQFIKALGQVIRRVRKERTGLSGKQFAYQYEIECGNFNRIENGKQNAALYFIWGIAEALGMKCSELIKLVEEELGDDFSVIDK